MKILLLGAQGQVGRELLRDLPSIGKVKPCGRLEVDLTDLQSIISAIDIFCPDVIVNAAAYTAVDKAESEHHLAFKINSEAVGVIAQEAVKRDIWLIHYSTDYVFDGNKTIPYLETDTTRPINIYGKTKLAGEQAIISSGCKHLIFRTTWIIGRDGQNFVKTILRLMKKQESLNVIDDQFGVPTTPVLIARVTVAAINSIVASNAWSLGIYHLTPHGKTTWYGITQTLLQMAKEYEISLTVDESSLYPITTAEYLTPAMRPANSLLNTRKLEQLLAFNLPSWKDDFLVVASEILKQEKLLEKPTTT